MNPDFISIEDVAAECRISHITARKRLVDGSIPGRVLHHGIPRVDRKIFMDWHSSRGSRK